MVYNLRALQVRATVGMKTVRIPGTKLAAMDVTNKVRISNSRSSKELGRPRLAREEEICLSIGTLIVDESGLILDRGYSVVRNIFLVSNSFLLAKKRLLT